MGHYRGDSMERSYCLMWITHYYILEFLHVLQLPYVVLELCYVVSELRSVVLELRSVVLEILYLVLLLPSVILEFRYVVSELRYVVLELSYFAWLCNKITLCDFGIKLRCVVLE